MADTAVARETLFALRETIAKLEGKPQPALAAEPGGPVGGRGNFAGCERLVVSTGADDLDSAMQGGVPCDGLTEIRALGLRDAGATSGFALALAVRCRMHSDGKAAVLWIADAFSVMEAGYPYAVGLRDFGLDPEGFVHASPRKLEDALWIAEAALASAAFAAVILEIRGNPARFGLTENRRLALRAKAAGCPLFLLRHGGEEEASSAVFRLCVGPAPSSMRFLPDHSMLGGSIGNSVFRLVLEKSRNSSPLSFLLEWNPHDRQFYPVDAVISEHEHPSLHGTKPAHSGSGFSASSNRSDRPQAVGSVLAFGRAS